MGTADAVEVQILTGSLVVAVDGARVPLNSILQQRLLTELILAEGASVPRTDLIERLWPVHRPGDADNLLSTHVGRLRRLLDRDRSAAGSAIPRSNRGYRVDLDRVVLDTARFRGLLDQLRRTRPGGPSPELIDAAYALLDGVRVPGGRDDRLRPLLEEVWRQARRICEIVVVAGPTSHQWSQLEGYLTAARERAPFDEQIAAWWLACLGGTGRVGEALSAYPQIAASLREELGTQPGAELSAVHLQLLDRSGDDVAPDGPLAETATTSVGPDVSGAVAPATEDAGELAQTSPLSRSLGPSMTVPAPPVGFAGRGAALDRLAQLAAGPRPAYGPRTVVITGPAGIGKSAAVLAAAATLGAGYPDGRVYLDFAAVDRLLDPDDVMASLLTGLGDDPADLPEGHTALLTRLRTRTADRRLLIILDNVGPLDPVGELVPNAPESLLLVTCRTPHPDLLGSPLLDLIPLTSTETMELLAAGLGRRPAASAEVDELVELTEGRPVAVRICAQLLASHPGWTVRRLIDRLADAERRFDVFSHVDRGLAAVFAEGTRDLTASAADALDAFGLLGLSRVEPWMIATVLDIDIDDATDALDDLTAARLIDDVSGDLMGDLMGDRGGATYAVSSLLRTFAGRRWRDRGAAASASAVSRYVGTLVGALQRRPRNGDRRVEPSVVASVMALPESTLVAAVELAGRYGLASACAELAQLLGATLFADRNSFEAWRHTHDHALSQIRTAGTPAAEAGLALSLARLHLAREQFAAAEEKLAEADRMATGAGAVQVRAEVRLQRATLWAETHRCRSAVEALNSWLDDSSVDDGVRAEGLRQRAAALRDLGEFEAAQADADRAYAMFVARGDRIGEGLALRSRGLNRLAVGDPSEAMRLGMAAEDALSSVGARLMTQYAVQLTAKARFRSGAVTPSPSLAAAREVCAELHDDFGQALMLRTLGEEALALGDLPASQEYLAWSLKLWHELDLPGWQARTLRDLADCVRRQGDLAEAVLMRAAALRTFDQLGLRESRELRSVAS